jgi:hypothetical protein
MREHFEHHRGHMLGCLAAASVLAIGIVFAIPAVAIVGGVACAVMCASMIWMMVTAGRAQ